MTIENHFASTINQNQSIKPFLPIVHTCESYDFRDIASNKVIQTSPCNVFVGENLSYFFYGKPSYRTGKNDYATTLNCYFPISIVLDTKDSIQPERVFAMDSGAFHNGFFGEHFHKKMKLGSLALDANMETPAKLVNQFFGSNYNYYYGKVSKDINIDPLAFEAQCYLDMIQSLRRTNFDNRSSSIELQFNKDIALTGKNVLLVILPTIYLDNADIVDLLINQWKAEVRTYHTYQCNPNEYIALINAEMGDYLDKNGYFK